MSLITSRVLLVSLAIFLVEFPLLSSIYWMMGNYSELRFNAWPISEWLINYQGGFVRRGLLGEVLYQLYSPNSLITKIYSLVIFLYLAYVLLFFVLYRLTKIKNLKVLIVSLLIQGGIFHMGISSEFYTRKEMLFLIFFAYLCILWRMHQISTNRSNVYLVILILSVNITAPFLILIHEPYFLMSFPLSCLLIWIAIKDTPNSNLIHCLGLLLYISVATSTFFICISNSGNDLIANSIWQSLPFQNRFSLSPTAPYTPFGPINSIGWTFDQHWLTMYGVLASGGVYIWLLFFISNFASLVYVVNQLLKAKLISETSNFIPLLVLGFVSSLSIFLLAADWGRWIAFMFNQLFLFTFVLKHSTYAKQKFSHYPFLKIYPYLRVMDRPAVFIGIVILDLTLAMPECCVQYPYIFINYNSYWDSLKLNF